MNLSENELFKIANSQTRFVAQTIVREHIWFGHRSLSDIWRKEILVDLILDLINHCLRKGFSLNDCLICTKFLYESIDQLRKRNNTAATSNASSSSASSLVNSIEMLNFNLAKLEKQMNIYKLKFFMDYLNLTLFQHFQLYKYVFTFDRENHTIEDERQVACPPRDNFQQSRLADTKTFSMYEFEQKLSQYEQQERSIKEKYAVERDKLVRQEEMAKNLIKYIQNDAYGANRPLDEQAMKRLIDDVSTPIVEATKNTIRCEVDEIKQRGLMNIEKQRLEKPVPLELNLPKTSKNSLISSKVAAKTSK